MANKSHLQSLMEQVQSNPKYRAIMPDLVKNLCQKAIQNGLTGKAAVKEVRNKLYQIGGAYFKRKVDITQARTNLAQLPKKIQASEVKQFCLEQMQAHASTAERLPIIETFFKTSLASISPIESVLDLACGLNPLALPWMPLADDFSYQSCDIYLDMLGLIQTFFDHFIIQGRTCACNLASGIPQEHAQVGFFLKSLPCLEQLDKSIGTRLLEELRTDHILVSFPVHSLGGMNKGMPAFYREHFYDLIAEKHWEVQEFCFETELAFLVSK